MRSPTLLLSFLFVSFLSGCSEGTKAKPLPRAGFTAPELPVPLPNVVDPKVDPVASPKTLYERLGREEGLKHLVNMLVLDLGKVDATKPLAAKLNKRALVAFFMEVSVMPRPKLADEVMLTAPEWALLLPALRATLSEQNISDADCDDFLAKIDKGR